MAHRFIKKFPKGYGKKVGERGGKLSGGERQRIALARMALQDAPLLVLDEPTNHLDGEALRHVNEALGKLMADRSALLVTHRAETLRLADRVLLLDDGRLVADGSHEELQKRSELYRTLLAELGGSRKGRRGGP